MPKNKDLKRLVRARMQKTGESYTTARRHLVARRPARPPTPPAGLASRAGVRDEVVEAKTGKPWAAWVATLDAAGALSLTHTAIAALVHERFGVPGWWAQTVTVGYERIRGRRAKNQVASGFAVSKAKTFPVGVTTLQRAFTERSRAQWLGADPVKQRRSSKPTVVRWQNTDGTWVDVYLTDKGPDKSSASVQHTRLASSADVERWRRYWTERLDALAAWLAEAAGADRAFSSRH